MGWDDNYSRENFKGRYQRTPTMDGAWLCKNSGGHFEAGEYGSTSTGAITYQTTGYFWLSYDYPIEDITAVDFEAADKHENLYCYEGETNCTGQAPMIPNYVTMNVFTARAYNKGEPEVIDSVMAQFNANVSYECTVYVNPVIKNGKLAGYSGKSDTVSGTTKEWGFYTFGGFSSPACVTEGDTFAVCIKTDKVEGVRLKTSIQSIGQGYMGESLDHLYDLVEHDEIANVIGKTCVPRIRALTNKAEGIVLSDSLSVDKTSIDLKKGEASTISATVYPENTTHRSCGFYSDNEAVATVDQNGNIKAVGKGSCHIIATAYDGQSRATVDVAVTEPASAVTPVTPQTPKAGFPKSGATIKGITYQYKNGGLSVTKIKDASKVKIPATVTYGGTTYKVLSIAPKAGKDLKKVTKITIPNNVTTIGTNAFSGCKKLTTVSIGSGVTSIGNKAFYNCKNLKKVTITSQNLKDVGKRAFKGIADNAVIKVPKRTKVIYMRLFKNKMSSTTVLK